MRGKDRTPEIEFALQQLLQKAKELEIDALLIAGDIFDTTNPPAEAERVAYQFFRSLNEAGIPAIAIAGNHDSPNRIDSMAQILPLAGVWALGRPRRIERGGMVSIETRNGKLNVAAVPFASERRLFRTEDLWEDLEDDARQILHYRERLSYLLQSLARGFEDDGVNVLMAHLTMGTAKLSNSERMFDSIGAYVLSGQALPSAAQYVALGHVHRPQRIEAAAPTYYSGSLIQVDFGEAGERKGCNLIVAEPGRPATVEFVPIACQKPLLKVECNVADLEDVLADRREHPGYLKVVVRLERPQPGLADLARQICPQVLQIEPRYPEAQRSQRDRPAAERLDPVEEFRSYYRDRLGVELKEKAIAAFQELYREMQHEAD